MPTLIVSAALAAWMAQVAAKASPAAAVSHRRAFGRRTVARVDLNMREVPLRLTRAMPLRTSAQASNRKHCAKASHSDKRLLSRMFYPLTDECLVFGQKGLHAK